MSSMVLAPNYWIGIIIVFSKIPSMNIIHIAIKIIIQTSCSIIFSPIYKDISSKILVVKVNCVINYCNYHICIALGSVPCIVCTDHRQMPLVRIMRIIWYGCFIIQVSRLGINNMLETRKIICKYIWSSIIRIFYSVNSIYIW